MSRGPRDTGGPGSGAELFADERPSFAPLDLSVTGPVGVIDVGSNSVRLVVFEGAGRSPAPVFNEKSICGLGDGLAASGRLSPEGRTKARTALGRFARLAEQMEVSALEAVATAAMRSAEDGPEFRRLIARETGVRLKVISGEEEARFAAMGVLFGRPDAEGLVADMGGASLDICRIARGKTGDAATTALGPLRLARDADSPKRLAAVAEEELKPLAPRFAVPGGTLWLVGGSFRALARVNMHQTGYPVPILHEYDVAAAEMLETAHWAARQPARALGEIDGVSSARAPNLPAAAAILAELIGMAMPARVVISGFGLREGVMFRRMPDLVRRRDPLIDACLEQESRRARFPGFGGELGRWLLTALEPADATEARLMRAAALLCDVNWRTHPDYRNAAAIETATRVHITGAGHAGRAFIAAALLLRHKAGRKTIEREPLIDLLDAESRARAETLGRAIRLATTLSGAAPGVLAACPLSREPGGFVLEVSGACRDLVTGDVERRLASLAEPLGLSATVRFG